MERHAHSTFDPDTLCAHAGIGAGDGVPLVTPIVQSTTYCRDGVGSGCEHQYSRVSNPTVAALESALGRLEDAPPAVCFSSGLAAEATLFLALLSQGDHVVCGRSVYGGTTRLLRQVLSGLGVECTFADSSRPEAVAAALRPETRLVFVESPANPTLELTDIAAVAELGRRAGVLVAADNTFLTPVLQRPLELGADLSLYSTTKFIDGHSAAVGGAVVARDGALLERLRFLRKCVGTIQTPLNAWLTLQGLKTLPIRLARQCETAARLAAWLAEHPAVERVAHPSLDGFPQRDLADRQHLGGHGAIVALELRGGVEAGRRAASALRLCRLVEHVGSVETLVTHPATMTHADVPAAQRRDAGISDGLLRLSVGLESFEAIASDLDQALIAASAEEVAPCRSAV